MKQTGYSLDQISSYTKASSLSSVIYEIVSSWAWFDKKTLGSQLIDAVDSIAANIAEGYGRYHKKDKIKFYFNARGSLYESIHWINKTKERKLVSQKNSVIIDQILSELPKEINSLIILTNKNLKY